jgi:hypothetical protein
MDADDSMPLARTAAPRRTTHSRFVMALSGRAVLHPREYQGS